MIQMRGLMTFCFAAFLMAGVAARGESWTNAAGHAVEAELLRLDGSKAVFKLPDGTTMEVPLSSLSTASRVKAESDQGHYRVPVPARQGYDHYVLNIKRLRSLNAAKKLDDHELAELRQVALAGLRDACSKLNKDGKLTSEDVVKIVQLAEEH